MRCVTTASDPDADVDFGKAIETEDEERLVDLVTTVRLWLSSIAHCGVP